jgi:hypothetical protein
MARMTKKLLREIWMSTAKCWEAALDDYYGKNSDRRPYSNSDIHPADKEAVDQLYREKVLKLSTEELELIVESYKKKKIKRAPVTISAIVGELLERQLRSKKKPIV